MTKYLVSFHPQVLLLKGKKEVENLCIFTQKWLNHQLLRTPYIVTTETDQHQTCLKMRVRDKRRATENVRC